jgi:hypothetical protein
MSSKLHSSPFVWNAGAWFGAMIGSTIWLLALGVGALSEDRTTAVVVSATFVAANLWGILLWRRRARLSAAAIVTANIRVPSVLVPHWAIALPLLLMAMFWLRQRFANGALHEVAGEPGRRR